jgi:D-glycero-D-manno-heptose 1,7-bisphosphate phosphatase
MKVAFLDRDGVINKDAGYTYKIDDFEFIDGCIDALKTIQEKNYQIIIVTNQSGIGRGYYSEAAYQKLTCWYCKQLLNQGITITDVFHCPHSPEDLCACRKPKEGLFLQAAKKYSIDFSNSFMVGDKVSDLQAAHAAGISRLVLINVDRNKKNDQGALIAAGLSKSIEWSSSLLEFSKTL